MLQDFSFHDVGIEMQDEPAWIGDDRGRFPSVNVLQVTAGTVSSRGAAAKSIGQIPHCVFPQSN